MGLKCLDQFCPIVEKPTRENLVNKYNHSVVSDEQQFEIYERQNLVFASRALQNYQSSQQKFLSFLAKLLSFLTALGCGIVIAVAILSVLHVSLLSVIFASLMFSAGVLSNYIMLKNKTYRFFESLIGKERFFQGFFEYVNEFGETVELSIGQKIIFTSLGSDGAISRGCTGGNRQYRHDGYWTSRRIFIFDCRISRINMSSHWNNYPFRYTNLFYCFSFA